MMLSYSKKKDLSPIKTISKIKGILQGLGITAREVVLKASDSCYSCVIECNEYNFFLQNGKGTSLEYALAGGYAEFMERLQNYALHLSGRTANKYRSDTILMGSKEFLSQDEETLKEMFLPLEIIDKTPQEIVKTLQRLIGREQFLTLPIYNLNKGKIAYYPFGLDMRPDSNGMCAGNTPEEAIVQGLSEICERYACRKIREERLTPPDIPREEYINYPEIRHMIEMYERLGFTLYIKDASLGLGLPVVCVAFINKKESIGCLKYASQPLLPIAIERCLTEFSQGHDWKDRPRPKEHFVKLFSDKLETITGFEVMLEMTGRGPDYAFPSFFGDKKSWEYDKNTFDNPRKTNKGLCKSLVNKIKSLGYNIYIRDASFLGFCSYQILIPQMGLEQIRHSFRKKLPEKIQNKIKNIKQLMYLAERFSFMTELAVFFIEEEYDKCINKISFRLTPNYPYLAEERDISDSDKTFLRIIKEYAELKLENCWTDDEIKNSLYAFYEQHQIDYLYSKWIDNDPFVELLRMADEMIIDESKDLEKEENKAKPLLTLLAEKYKENPPDQMAMKKFFDDLDNLSPEEEYEPDTSEALQFSESSLASSYNLKSETFSISTNFKL